MDQLIAVYMTIAAAFLGVDVPDEPPRLRFAPRCEIHRFALGDESAQCGNPSFYVTAAYQRGVIWLPVDEFDLSDLYSQGVLLHEVLHYVQESSGMDFSAVECKARDIERPAYELMLRYFELTGMDRESAYEVAGINGLSYFMLTNCFEKPDRQGDLR